MHYRVTATLIFTSPDEARDFYHDCEKAIPKAITLNKGKLIQEHSQAILEECHHDEQPFESCIALAEHHTP